MAFEPKKNRITTLGEGKDKKMTTLNQSFQSWELFQDKSWLMHFIKYANFISEFQEVKMCTQSAYLADSDKEISVWNSSSKHERGDVS